MALEIKGTVKAVIFYSERNNFQIVKFNVKGEYLDDIEDYFNSKTITIKGNFDRKLSEGEILKISGDVVNDKNYGNQLNVLEFEREVATTNEALVKYLTSDLFPGVGELTAKRVVDALGQDLIEKVFKDPKVLDSIKLNDRVRETIKEGIIQDKLNSEAIMYFLNGGLTLELASLIINTVSLEKIGEIYDNPYRILYLNISGATFKKIDEFCLKKNVEYNDERRIKAILYHLIRLEAENEGCTFIYKSELFNNLTNVLSKEKIYIDINDFERLLNSLIEEKKVVLEDDKVFISFFQFAEFTSAARIFNRVANRNKKIEQFERSDVKSTLDRLIDDNEFPLSNEQYNAILESFENNCMVITGGPGTGKTTIIKFIVAVYASLTDSSIEEADIALLAPTGRAAKRMSESCNHESSTIHRYLGYDGAVFNVNHSNYNKEKLVIVDESSMMDIALFYHLLDGIYPFARIIFVGDVDQLPAIGAGNVLSDIIESNIVKTIRLNEIFRQEENSHIIELSRMINNGVIDNSVLNIHDDLIFVEESSNNVKDVILSFVRKLINQNYDLLNDIEIIIPMYQGMNGIDAINSMIQNEVNYVEKEYDRLKYGFKDFRVNDKVIQLINRPEKNVMNGDIGYVDSFIRENGKIKGLVVQFDEAKVSYSMDEIPELRLAYAITVHKAQGSEFNVIIMPIVNEQYFMLKRKLIYTGCTRAKNLLILIGSFEMLKNSVRRVEELRNTMLKEYLIKLGGNEFDSQQDNKLKPFSFDLSLEEFIKKEENKNEMFEEYELGD